MRVFTVLVSGHLDSFESFQRKTPYKRMIERNSLSKKRASCIGSTYAERCIQHGCLERNWAQTQFELEFRSIPGCFVFVNDFRFISEGNQNAREDPLHTTPAGYDLVRVQDYLGYFP